MNNKIYNTKFIEILDEFKNIMELKGDVFRAKAYQTAIESIIIYNKDIIEPKIQLKLIKGIGNTIYSNLIEFVETGNIHSLEVERNNPLIQFTKIYGIGPKKAQELISQGFTNISQLTTQKGQSLLNDKQKIGVKYYEYINQKIPRSEIDEYKKVFDKIIEFINKNMNENKIQYEVVGSYRRGKDMSGDIDVIITDKLNNKTIFDTFLDLLIKNGIIIEVLSRGKIKSLTICNLCEIYKNNKINYNLIPRRIDFLYCSKEEYPFSLLYFTGSKIFNTIMRQRAVDMGYTLNEHGINYMKNGIKSDIINQEFKNEKDIFEFLNIEYKEPSERIDGRSIIILNNIKKEFKENKVYIDKDIQMSNHILSNISLNNTSITLDTNNDDNQFIFPILFGEASTGKIKQWSIRVYKEENGENTIIEVEHGYIDGKKQNNKKIISKGKNIGKKNETNSFQQAMSEAKTQWIKKRESGYSEKINSNITNNINDNINDINDNINDIDNVKNKGKGIDESVPSVMLAHDYNKRGKDIKFPCFIQRKLDGTRCIALSQKGLFTRNKKKYPNLEHIISEINTLPNNIILDGELYSDTLTFQEIVSIVKRETLKDDDLKKQFEIKYHVYDIINDEPYIKRYNLIKDIFNKYNFKFLSMVDTEICNNEEDMREKHNEYVFEGYEGVMLRNKNGKYKGVRSIDLQKYKQFQDKEYEVVGYNQGQGLENGCVIWICKTENGKIFNCRPRGTRDDRQIMFLNGEKYIGKLLNVRYQEETDDCIPRFPVGISFRDYE